MTDEDKHIEFFDLTVKYLSGQASDSEVKRLEIWVLAAPENKDAFNEVKQTWMLTGIEHNRLGLDVEQEWKQLDNGLFSENKVVKMKPRRRLGFYLSLAAAVLALIAISVWVFMPQGNLEVFSTQNQVAVNNLPDGSQVSMILDGLRSL